MIRIKTAMCLLLFVAFSCEKKQVDNSSCEAIMKLKTQGKIQNKQVKFYQHNSGKYGLVEVGVTYIDQTYLLCELPKNTALGSTVTIDGDIKESKDINAPCCTNYVVITKLY